jgi:hypothetical protein
MFIVRSPNEKVSHKFVLRVYFLHGHGQQTEESTKNLFIVCGLIFWVFNGFSAVFDISNDEILPLKSHQIDVISSWIDLALSRLCSLSQHRARIM